MNLLQGGLILYGSIIRVNKNKHKINAGIIVLLFFILIYSGRFIKVLKSNTENGALPYVQLLNFGMPAIECEIYDESAYGENKLTLKTLIIETLGLNKLNSNNIIGNEISYFATKTQLLDSIQTTADITPFNIDEATIIRVDNVSDDSLKKELDKSKPEVLIYHTHATEAYMEGGIDSNDENYNIVGIGNVLTEELENTYGISVIHDKTNHSEVYNDSYARSIETVQKYLNEYGDNFKLIIDLHRDSVENKNAVTAIVNGESTAKIMFVTAAKSTRYSANQALADEFYNKANEIFPGFTRSHMIYNYGAMRRTQSLSDSTLLIECGANVNTVQEAKNSAKLIARLIAEHINRVKAQ